MTTPAAPYTLAQLLTVMQQADVEGQLLAFLQAEGLPAISEWAGEPTGLEMTFVQMVSRAINDLAQSGAPAQKQIAAMAAARFLAYAQGGWLDLHAWETYRVLRNQPTKTTFSLTLVAVATAPAYQFQPGDLWVVGPTGNRYQSTTGGDLEPGGTLVIAFAAENTGSTYDDDPSSVTLQLSTAPAGVSISTAVGDFTVVAHTAGSTGFITPTRTDPATVPTPHTFAIRIEVAGDPGDATYSVQVDSGAFVFKGILNASNDITIVEGTETIETGTSFGASLGTSPAFLAGDVFTFTTPGSPNYVQGDDLETDPALAQRCRGMWQAISPNVMDGKAILWAVTALPSINRASVNPDTVTPGRWIITLADTHGGIDRAGLAVVEAFAKARLGTGEDMGAAAATNRIINPGGNVRVPAGTTPEQLAEIQATAEIKWRAFLASIPLGPGVFEAAVNLIAILIDAGAVDVGDAVAVFPIEVPLEIGEVPVAVTPLAELMQWGSV